MKLKSFCKIGQQKEDKFYYEDGTTSSEYDDSKVLHRKDGPAAEYADGSREWYLHGKFHRIGGPAVENSNGSKCWFVNGKRHRVDGPAIEQFNGSKYWYVNNNLHREDGPAVEDSDGTKQWYYNGLEFYDFNENNPPKTWPPTKEDILQKKQQNISNEFDEDDSSISENLKNQWKQFYLSEDISQYKYTGPEKLWVQMDMTSEDLQSATVKGEVCVTPFGTGEKIFRESNKHTGYVWKGKPSYFFPFDVFSQIDESGKRYIDWPRLLFNINQKEGWLDPSKSKLIGLIYVTNEKSKDDFINNDEEGLQFFQRNLKFGLRGFLRLSTGQIVEIFPNDLLEPEEQKDIELKQQYEKKAQIQRIPASNDFMHPVDTPDMWHWDDNISWKPDSDYSPISTSEYSNRVDSPSRPMTEIQIKQLISKIFEDIDNDKLTELSKKIQQVEQQINDGE